MNNFNKSIVAIHAHPDDTEAFCSGTLALLKNAGFQITIVTMTAGGLGSVSSNEKETIELRHNEAAKAAAEIGADYYCLGGRDGYLYDTEELRIAVTDIIRKVKAGIVFTHLPNDYHADHRTTANIVEAGSMVAVLPNVPCKEKPLEITPLLYHTAPLGFSDTLGNPVTPPHFFIDITNTIEKKMDMLAHHHSQIDLMKEMHNMDNFFEVMKEYNKDLGKLVNCKYAEVFWQHLGGGFQHDPLIQQTLKDYIKDTPEEMK